MSFDFSDLVIPDDGVDNFNFDYSQFLADPIYDWLNLPEEVLQVCQDLEEEEKEKRKVTIIQQPQPYKTGRQRKVSYRRGPYRKRKDENN